MWTLIWLLGSSLCQDYIGTRRDKNAKTYDNTTHHVDDEPEGENDTYAMYDDVNEDKWLKTLAAENDEDATLVMNLGNRFLNLFKSESEFSLYYYSSYQDARRRLSEGANVRGFWLVRKRSDKGF